MKRSVLMWLTAIAGMLLAAPAFAQGTGATGRQRRCELGGVNFRFRHGDCLGRLRLRARESGHRAELRELMDEPCTRAQLRACLRDIARLNRWFLGYRPLFHWLNLVARASSARAIRILDVGCGNGDALRRTERWALQRGVAVN